MNVGQEKQAQNQGYLKMVGYAHRIQVAMHYHPWTELWEGQVWSLDKVVCLPLGFRLQCITIHGLGRDLPLGHHVSLGRALLLRNGPRTVFPKPGQITSKR